MIPPQPAAKIGDLFGSDLAVATTIHMAWPNPVHRRKHASGLSPWGSLNGESAGQDRVDGVSASAIGHWQWKAIFRATWLSRTKNSTPSPAFLARPWMNFSLASDGLVPRLASLIRLDGYHDGFSFGTSD
jgi:hypothetical protein